MYAHRYQDGPEVLPSQPLDDNPRTIERARDVTILKMRSKRMTYRAIGRYLGLNPGSVWRRLKAMTPEAREHYERAALG